MILAGGAALLAVIAVLVALVVRQLAHRAVADAEVARTSAGDADRSARFAAGRARAMAEHRPLIESVLVEWGLNADRARQVVRELHDRVADELRVQAAVDGSRPMTADRAESFRLPRDGGPARPAGGAGPQGTRRERAR